MLELKISKKKLSEYASVVTVSSMAQRKWIQFVVYLCFEFVRAMFHRIDIININAILIPKKKDGDVKSANESENKTDPMGNGEKEREREIESEENQVATPVAKKPIERG